MGDSEESNRLNLSDLFDNGFKLFNSVMETEEPTNSLKVQLDVKRCMKMLEDATRLVSLADIFSKNESFEEISTEQIKYFLLPAFLGTLATKLCDRENRSHNVNVSEVYFYDFLERVKSYGITDVEIPKRKDYVDSAASSNQDNSTALVEASQSNTEKIGVMVKSRQHKLQKFQDEKNLKENLKVLQQNMDNLNFDEDSRRKYFTNLVKLYAMQAVDEIQSLSQEKEILEHMAKMKRDGKEETKARPAPKLKPIIITRNEIQKQVYGAGYPSLPVMTVEEFYEKKVADGEWTAGPENTVGSKSLMDTSSVEGEEKERQEDPDDLEKERKIEEDSEEYLTQARALDDYKDTHKRGWGNRYNRS